MPLPTDEGLLALSQELLNQFDTIFGRNLGFRPAHAKGTLLTGMFTPSATQLRSHARLTSRARPLP
jgi:catalase